MIGIELFVAPAKKYQAAVADLRSQQEGLPRSIRKIDFIGSFQNGLGVNLSIFCLSIVFTGCMADRITLPHSVLTGLDTIWIVAVEPPPLEVIPDFLENRMPAYRHFNNMALPQFPDKNIYRNPGGILIGGLAGHEDVVERVDTSKPSQAPGPSTHLQSLVAQPGHWMPTLALSDEAMSKLNSNDIKAVKSTSFMPLLNVAGSRAPEFSGWRGKIERWYRQDTSLVNYNRQDIGLADAVLEIGIGRYHIFEGQIALQVLIKLIDPGTGKVIARTYEETSSYQAPALTLLAHEGILFKTFIRKMGARLLDHCFQEIGLMRKPLPLNLVSMPS